MTLIIRRDINGKGVSVDENNQYSNTVRFSIFETNRKQQLKQNCRFLLKFGSNQPNAVNFFNSIYKTRHLLII